jgi:murein DD-endopeptidase MepM/ murein hydrolase activator NlpD
MNPFLSPRTPVLLLAFVCALPPVFASEAEEMEDVLRELRQVETEIERQLAEQAGVSRPAAPMPATPAPEPSAAEPPPVPDPPADGLARDIQVLARAKVEARTRLTEAENAARISAALLAADLFADPSADERRIALALLQARHRAEASLAVEQLLRLEQFSAGQLRRERPAVEPASPPPPAADPLPPLPTRLDELRDRHRELSARLSELSDRLADSRRTAFPAAASRPDPRAELNALLGRLSPATAAHADGPKTIEAAPDAPPERLPAADDGRRVFWRAGRARIHAVADGTLLFSGPFAAYRHLVILDHGDGWTSVYGNMTRCYLEVGDSIAAGGVLGEYQAEAIGDPEPFWLEVRHETTPVLVESLPGIPTDWTDTLFS